MPVETQLGKSHTVTSVPFQSLEAMAVCIWHLRGRCDGGGQTRMGQMASKSSRESSPGTQRKMLSFQKHGIVYAKAWGQKESNKPMGLFLEHLKP